jgi:CRISPR-associated protein Cas1
VKHVSIVEHGSFLGVTGARLVVSREREVIGEYALNRLKTISVARNGVAFSSDLVLACAARGIKVFFQDFRGQAVAALAGVQQHAVTAVRRGQFRFCESADAMQLCRIFINGKLRNQRAVLLYFAKYHGKDNETLARSLAATAEQLAVLARQAKDDKLPNTTEDARAYLLGIEGQGAAVYWRVLRESDFLPADFKERTGRGARDVGNQALNYGYAVLTSMVWHCLINAGLEVYAGVLHTDRPGKPSLVLDVMEEYRAWVVDRVVIKLRPQFKEGATLDAPLKRRIVDEVNGTFARRYSYRDRMMTLEGILQRQVYHLGAHFLGERKYRTYLFRW